MSKIVAARRRCKAEKPQPVRMIDPVRFSVFSEKMEPLAEALELESLFQFVYGYFCATLFPVIIMPVRVSPVLRLHVTAQSKASGGSRKRS